MRELVDADSESLPTASTGGDVPQQNKISFPAAAVPAVAKLGHRRRGKTWDPKRGEEECSEGTHK